MNPDELVAAVDELTQVGAVFSSQDMLRCHKIGQAICALSRQRLREAISSNSGRPALFVYICDGWSARVRSDSSKQIGSHIVRRQGHFRHEFLLERGIFRYRSANGTEKLHMVFGAPRGLKLGKAAWNVLSACADFHPIIRAVGHSGLSLTVYIQDGALYSASMRLFRARHSLFYDCLDAAGEEYDPLERLRDLVIGVRCKAHGLHNSLTWGLGPYLSEQIADDARIVIASLLNCGAALHERIDLFLLRRVKFVQKTDSSEDVAAFWKGLEVSDDLMPMFLELDPFWKNGCLEVDERAVDDPDCLGKLSTLVLYGFRWLQWSLSRWTRAGRAGRYFLRSVALGVDGAVQEALSDPDCSNYLLNGYKRTSPAIRLMFTIVGFSARCVEPLLLDLLQDDRFLRKVQVLRDAMCRNLLEIASVRPLVWERFGLIVGLPPVEVRHATILSSAATTGYIDRDVFCDVRVEPLSLTQGSIEAKVAELANRNGEARGVAWQLKRLMELGEPQSHIVDALVLLRDSPCSSTLVEEGHSSAVVLKRCHEDYSEAALRCRALLHQQRALVRPCVLDRKIAAIDARVEALRQKQPEKINSRQALFKRNVEREMEADECEPSLRKMKSQRCMKEVAEEMAAMTQADMKTLRKEALDLRAASRQNINEAIQRNLERKRALILQKQERKTDGYRNHVDAARFLQGDLQAVCDILAIDEFRSMRPEHMQNLAGSAPAPPHPAEKAIFDKKAAELDDEPAATPPWWCRFVCPSRQLFHGVALSPSPDHQEWWLVLFAKQQPYQVTFLQLRMRVGALPMDDGLANTGGQMHALGHIEFEYLPPTYRTEQEVPFTDDDDIWCLEGIRMQGLLASTSHEPLLLERLMARGVPPKRPREAQRQRKTGGGSNKEDARAALLREFPWLDEGDLPKVRVAGARRRPATRAMRDDDGAEESPSGSDGGLEPPPLVAASAEVWEDSAEDAGLGEEAEAPEAALAVVEDDSVWEELAVERAAWSWDQQDEMNFFTRVLGGAWTKRELGVSADCVSGFARAWVKDWCIAFQWPPSARFGFARYGREGAHELCREWCRRSDFFYRLWLDSEDDAFAYSEDSIRQYTEDVPWLDFMCAQPADSPCFVRGMELRRMVPRLGVSGG